MDRIHTAALAVFVLVSVCSTATMAQDDNSLRSAIEAVNKHFTSALNQGDVADAVSVYADDAQILAANSEPIEGREAIRAYWQGILDAGIESGELKTLEVRGLGDYAYEVGTYRVMGTDNQLLDRGKHITLWKRVDGQWKMYRDISTSSMPLPEGGPMSGGG